ncbi:serine threonine protein kinase CMGC group [Fusarium oxysporum]|nr:serine threonine protein kinase CMGC group [Fusarium oxysporum]
MRTDSALSTIIPDTLSSNSQNRESTAIVEPKRTRLHPPVDAQTRVVERPIVLCTYKTPPYPLRKAGEVYVECITDQPHDDEDGNYVVVPGAKLTEGFQVVKLLGQGGYGRVVAARHRKRKEFVAIKINALGQGCRDAAMSELRILQTLRLNDKENHNRCIHLRRCFEYCGHICMVMDLLGQSTYDFLRDNKFVPFPNSHLQSFARQLFGSIAFLQDLGLVHADIKPDNIVLCDQAYQTFTYNRMRPSFSAAKCGQERHAAQRRVLRNTEIRLIDFGLATFQDESPRSFLSTPPYSAPETWLDLQASFPRDIWSIGCTLVEFFTGDVLFDTVHMPEYLAMIEAVAGLKMEEEIARAADTKFEGIFSAFFPMRCMGRANMLRRWG